MKRRTIIYDRVRDHLTATDKRAIRMAMEKIGNLDVIRLSPGRNRYLIRREADGFLLTIQNRDGVYIVPFSIEGE